jgi:xylulokinase
VRGELLLGIDVGMYSSYGVVVTPAGEVVRQAFVEHGMDVPQSGWAEQDADGVWWHDVVVLCRRLLDGDPYQGDDVAGVALSAIGPCLLPPLGARGAAHHRIVVPGLPAHGRARHRPTVC